MWLIKKTVDASKAKNFRGLGIRRLDDFNQALLCKWLWRFSIEYESLWRKIICRKFKKMEGSWTIIG